MYLDLTMLDLWTTVAAVVVAVLVLAGVSWLVIQVLARRD